MSVTFEGKLLAAGLRFGIVVSRWNSFITERMLSGAMDTLIRHGAVEDDIEIARTPGTWEIPIAAQRFARSGRVHAVVSVGCLIRGSTPHFEYLAAEVTKGLAQVSLATDVPVTYGIITVENLEQAIERAGSKAGNKGAEAAAAAIEMANLLRDLA
ncbi:MAG: 6,7-dimethyl-8-ribityllumazine synthase [Chthonomonadales bacterium]|nr:6,7-dimethyl-8-ribityllumazine synthase [Chthonomonadales bacterium]